MQMSNWLVQVSYDAWQVALRDTNAARFDAQHFFQCHSVPDSSPCSVAAPLVVLDSWRLLPVAAWLPSLSAVRHAATGPSRHTRGLAWGGWGPWCLARWIGTLRAIHLAGWMARKKEL